MSWSRSDPKSSRPNHSHACLLSRGLDLAYLAKYCDHPCFGFPRSQKKDVRLSETVVVRTLNKDNVAAAAALVKQVFHDPHAGREVRMASRREPYREHDTGKLITADRRNWVAVDESSQTVLGVIGLYTCQNDRDTAWWLDWFCVSPKARGQGLGAKLLEFAIQQARATGKPFLRLYTETDPTESVAQLVYDKWGLKVVKREPVPGTPFVRLFRELRLNGHVRAAA